MGFQLIQSSFKYVAEIPLIAPYYGTSSDVWATESTVLSLAGRGPTAGTVEGSYTFEGFPGNTKYYYFAYPRAWGWCEWYATNPVGIGVEYPSGAYDDVYSKYGPRTINVTVGGVLIPFFVIRSEYECEQTTTYHIYPIETPSVMMYESWPEIGVNPDWVG